MPTLTAASVTDKQIRDLRAEAVQAGDWRQVDLCDVALGIRPQHTATDRGSIKDSSGRSITRAKARSACAKVISYAQGEAGHGASSPRHHATKKKSPAQLQREIDEALAPKGISPELRGTLERYPSLISQLGGYGARVRGQSVGEPGQIVEGALGETGHGGFQPTITTDAGTRYRVRLDTIEVVRRPSRSHSTRAKGAKITESEITYAMKLLDAPGEGEAEDETLRILKRDMSDAHARRVLRAAIDRMSRTW